MKKGVNKVSSLYQIQTSESMKSKKGNKYEEIGIKRRGAEETATKKVELKGDEDEAEAEE